MAEADKTKTFLLDGEELTLEEFYQAALEHRPVVLTPFYRERIQRSRRVVEKYLREGRVVYGINTGFGKLARTRIPATQLGELQANLLRSHAAGVGDYLEPHLVRLLYLLKISSLGRGYSGVRLELVERLIQFYHADVLPAIHLEGSVGASGDLAPLADFSLPLIGEGWVLGEKGPRPAAEVLREKGLEPLPLAEKEGLSLINGTQFTLSLALEAWFGLKRLLDALTALGAFSTEVLFGSDEPFREEVQAVRGQWGQRQVAARLRRYLENSPFRASHAECGKVQDPYSLRCLPQVHGSAYQLLEYARGILEQECNSTTDNPIVLPEQEEILTGGNFHAAPLAHVLDALAIVAVDCLGMCERRIALYQDPNQSGLAAFLAEKPGLQSGFMLAHVTAAALVSDLKRAAHPHSVDTIPTSAGQEDHVSMAPAAALKLKRVIRQGFRVAAIEWLCAARARELHPEMEQAERTGRMYRRLREKIPAQPQDHPLSGEIEQAAKLLAEGVLEGE